MTLNSVVRRRPHVGRLAARRTSRRAQCCTNGTYNSEREQETAVLIIAIVHVHIWNMTHYALRGENEISGVGECKQIAMKIDD